MPVHHVFAIQHKPTGAYLPEPAGRYNRGGSHCKPSFGPLRLFKNHASASRALANWLKGIYVTHRGYDSLNGEYYEKLTIIPQPHRKKSEMAVVRFALVFDPVDPDWEVNQSKLED